MNTPSTDSTPNAGPAPPPQGEARRALRTADLAAAGTALSAREDNVRQRPAPLEPPTDRTERRTERATPEAEELDALFAPDVAARFRQRWSDVQRGFVDDPRHAVAEGDELVAQVMQSLAESFAGERKRLEEQLSQTGEATTETLRVALRRYRSFFERLLSL